MACLQFDQTHRTRDLYAFPSTEEHKRYSEELFLTIQELKTTLDLTDYHCMGAIQFWKEIII